MLWPCETRTSTCRNFATISSGVYRFFGIAVLLHVKRHSSGRTTSKGEDQCTRKNGPPVFAGARCPQNWGVGVWFGQPLLGKQLTIQRQSRWRAARSGASACQENTV